MRHAVLWVYHYLYWLSVHRHFGRAYWCANNEMGAWK